jgi:prephenate dehydrogenase
LKIAILGAGLIGGSIGLAARRRVDANVCGYDPDPRACPAALELGAIDEQAPDIAAAVAGAQVVFAAAPVGVLAETVREALEHAGDDCVVSDVGSTKLALEQARRDPRFVGGHPLAGSHTAGVEHAREDMFDGATWYLCPADNIAAGLYERLHDLIVAFGAEPIPVDADIHDRLMATVSQLPHVLANVLVEQLAAASRDDQQPASSRTLGVRPNFRDDQQPVSSRTLGVGPSFRDATRVAGSNTAIWTDIYLANRDALIEAIEQAVLGLEDVRSMLTRADAGALAGWNERARAARAQLLGDDLDPTRPRAQGASTAASAGDAPLADAAP